MFNSEPVTIPVKTASARVNKRQARVVPGPRDSSLKRILLDCV
jgi:hypothetical protein